MMGSLAGGFQNHSLGHFDIPVWCLNPILYKVVPIITLAKVAYNSHNFGLQMFMIDLFYSILWELYYYRHKIIWSIMGVILWELYHITIL